MIVRSKYPTMVGSMLLFVLLVIELVSYAVISSMKVGRADNEYAQRIASQSKNYEKERTSLIKELELSKYLVTGKNSYERIFNGKQRDVNVLIEKLAAEAVPSDWRVSVEMEEFTKTLLILQPKIGQRETQSENIFHFLLPILDHSHKYLGNVAIYNTKHQCRFFLDEYLLDELRARRELSEASILQAKRKGSSFSRYDAIAISFEEIHGQFMVPAVISGANGTRERVMMLLEVIQKPLV